MTPSAQPQLDRQAAFWDARAADYPDPRDAALLAQQQRRMSHVPAQARPASGLRLLDVGTGTGALALHALAQHARVTALDISGAMLRRLGQAAGAATIELRQADWRTLDVDGLGWRRAFDRVYAQMMPSFREAADFARFEACSRGWCVFIGWGRERHDAWLQAAFAAHGVPWEVPAGVPLAAAQLQTLGRQPVPVYWRETWQRRRTLEQAMADACDHLQVRGATPDPQWLRELRGRPDAAALVQDCCEVEIGLLAWPAPA
jgi:SAM-dependent methyltransferase